MSSDDNNPSSSTSGDQLLLSSSSSTGRLFDMNSSAPPTRNEISLVNVKSAEELITADEVVIIFSFLSHADIMRARVCTTWRDAAKKTLVPYTNFRVHSVISYNAMRVMAAALPNFQQIKISSLCDWGCKYSNGEDPDEVQARRTDYFNTHDINIISNFRKLSSLEVWGKPMNGSFESLNGRYPVLFNFQLLRNLSISHCSYLKFDLDMLASPVLKELELRHNPQLSGNLSSLRTLKDTLEKVTIAGYHEVEGNFMDLADFPRLQVLNLSETAVTGDIRDIRVHDFPALEKISLPSTVQGGIGYKFQRVSDVSSFMQAIYLLTQRTPALFKESWFSIYGLSGAFDWRLSEHSPNWYDGQSGSPQPPLRLQFVRAGSRRGWSWCAYDRPWRYECLSHLCKINWLDPEASSESDDYEAYIEELKHFEGEINTDFYRGYHEPPTEMEYRRLCEGLEQRD